MFLRTRRLLVAGLAAAALGGCGEAERSRNGPPSQRDVAKAFQRILDEARKRDQGGRVGRSRRAWSPALVRRERRRRSPTRATGDRRHRVIGVASLTKTFVAALTARLAEQGDLDLDDPVARWVPRLPPRPGDHAAAAAQSHERAVRRRRERRLRPRDRPRATPPLDA